jgi:hypothetical protein
LRRLKYAHDDDQEATLAQGECNAGKDVHELDCELRRGVDLVDSSVVEHADLRQRRELLVARRRR